MVDKSLLSFVIITINQVLFILILVFGYIYFMKKRKINIYLKKKKDKEKKEVKLPPTAVKPVKTDKVTPLPQLSKSFQKQFLTQELESLNKKLEKKRKEQPYQAKMIKTEKIYKKKLAPVEAKLAEISPESLEEAKQRELCGRLRPGYLAEWDVDNDLSKIRCAMGKSETEPASFIGRVKKKLSPQEENVEELTSQLVKKISKKIEGKQPIPPNELIWIQQELQQLQEEINSQGV